MAKKSKIKKIPDFPAIAMNYYQAGKLGQAEAVCRQVLAENPPDADMLHLLGLIAAQTGRYEQAIHFFADAVYVDPRKHTYHYDLGLILHNVGAWKEAARSYREALRLKPDYFEAYYNLGNLFAQNDMEDQALENFNKALQLNPMLAEAYYNMGVIFSRREMPDEAIANYKKALSLKPDHAGACGNLGLALEEKEELDEAVDYYRKAIDLYPEVAEPYNNLAGALKNRGELDEAIALYKKALAIHPDNARIHANLGITLLLAGDFEQGWQEYEWTLKYTNAAPLTKPQWDGSPLDNKVVLVYGVHGYGDTLQFVRYLPLLHESGAKKVLFMPNNKGLEKLLKESDLKSEILDSETPVDSLDFDTNIHLLSLPRIFKTNLENIPFRQKRYLKADPEKVEMYRENTFKIQDSGFKIQPLKIGIFWQGNPALKPDRNRSMPLQHFYQICRLPGVRVFSLQKGPGMEQLKDLPEDIGIVNLGETFNDFSDTAAAIENLDLMITVDTAIGHVSGALGKKTWVLLPSHAEWRWHLDMDYSPWYEDMRLFRHKEPGKKDWAEMMERVKEQVDVEIKGR